MEYDYSNLPDNWAVINNTNPLFKNVILSHLNKKYNTTYSGSNSKTLTYGVEDGKARCKVDGEAGWKANTILYSFDEFLYKITSIKSLLPEFWSVVDDGSQLFRDKVVGYMMKQKTKHALSLEATGRWIKFQYGTFPDEIGFYTSHTPQYNNTKVQKLSLEEFINITENKNTINSPIIINTNVKTNTKGNPFKLQPKTPTITRGEKPTGHPISGRRRKTATSIGHLSNSAFAVSS